MEYLSYVFCIQIYYIASGGDTEEARVVQRGARESGGQTASAPTAPVVGGARRQRGRGATGGRGETSPLDYLRNGEEFLRCGRFQESIKLYEPFEPGEFCSCTKRMQKKVLAARTLRDCLQNLPREPGKAEKMFLAGSRGPIFFFSTKIRGRRTKRERESCLPLTLHHAHLLSRFSKVPRQMWNGGGQGHAVGSV